MESTILAADIGGTSSRFALFRTAAGEPEGIDAACELPTNQFDSLLELLQAAATEHSRLSPGSAAAVVLAVPGPVESEKRAHLANVKWPVDLQPLQESYGGRPFFLINDFEAQAYGCLTRVVENTRCIKEGRQQRKGVLAVIGAGTGLGHCSLKIDDRGAAVALPSEAGHAAFAFTDDREEGYRRFLLDTAGVEVPTGDLVVSGRGLALLHLYLSGEDLQPRQVVRQITPASATTRWFARFYGRACRHHALAALPTAGLFVSGGVAAKNPFLVDNDTFRTEFVRSDTKKELLSAIRIELVTEERIGLWGAARYGLQRLLR